VLGKSHKLLVSRAYLLLIASAVGLSLAIGYAIIERDRQDHLDSLRAELTEDVHEAIDHIKTRLFELDLVANRIESYIAVSATPPEEKIAQVARRLLDHNPEIIGVALAPGLEITRIFPLEGNENAIGLKYWQVPAQLPTVARAFRDRAPVLDGPVSLVQGGTGYILRYPVFIPQEGTGADRFWGVISIGITRKGLFNFTDSPGHAFGLREVYPAGHPRRVLHGAPADFDGGAVVEPARFLSSRWEIAARPAGGWPGYSPQSPRLILFTLLATGFLLATLLALRHVSMKSERAHALLGEAIECLHEGFVAFDQNDRIVTFNRRYADYHDRSSDLIRPGIRFRDLLRQALDRGQFPDAQGREEEWLEERMRHHRNPTRALLQQQADGRWLKVTEAKTPHGYTVGVRTDITPQIEAQEAAEAANRQKTQFLNNISHELRTPLTVISGMAAFMANENRLPQAQRLEAALASDPVDLHEVQAAVAEYRATVANQGGKVLASADHMLRLVGDLLDWTKAERGQLRLDPEPVSAAEVARAVVEDLRPQAEAKGLTLSCACDAPLLRADRSRLMQVLYNLTENAIKFTDSGSVTLTVRAEDDHTRFSVTDTGCGIEAGTLDRIFDCFEQADGSITRSHDGVGLGLAIARQIVDLHGGTLRAESTPGRGSRFSFDIPDAQVADISGHAVSTAAR
jgi:hypothetical protein